MMIMNDNDIDDTKSSLCCCFNHLIRSPVAAIYVGDWGGDERRRRECRAP